METNPAFYGLSPRVQLEELVPHHLAIRRVVKSRIIRKDAAKIAEMARQIKSVAPDVDVTHVCTRNICSKSLALLAGEGVGVKYVDEIFLKKG